MKKGSFIILLCMGTAQAEEVFISTPNGNSVVYEIPPSLPFSEAMHELQMELGHTEFVITYCANKAAQNLPRSYNQLVTADEKKDISYIVNTLGMASLVKIAGSKSSLKSAGDRVDHIHPLRFLQCIFTDEKMKASMEAMQNRSWIWKEFSDGLYESLNIEFAKGNLKKEDVERFAAAIGIPYTMLAPFFSAQAWGQLLSTIIKQVPKATTLDRYKNL